MNLYKLTVLHGAPKSSCRAIFGYMISSSVEEVYEKLNEEAFWSDGQSPKEKIIENCGDLEDVDWADAYYGVWGYGWEDLGEISEQEIAALKKFKILL